MFCDLVGSTAMSARLDPEDMREVISAYHRCCAGLIGRNGGFIAKYMGDGVLAYFGYPQAHEHDAERAVQSGLAIVEAAPKLVTAASSPLHVRIGIATGLVVVGDLIGSGEAQERGVVGETPNLAARLQASHPTIADYTLFEAPHCVAIERKVPLFRSPFHAVGEFSGNADGEAAFLILILILLPIHNQRFGKIGMVCEESQCSRALIRLDALAFAVVVGGPARWRDEHRQMTPSCALRPRAYCTYPCALTAAFVLPEPKDGNETVMDVFCAEAARGNSISTSTTCMTAGNGRTIGPRIRISRPDGGSARCNASRARAQPRSAVADP